MWNLRRPSYALLLASGALLACSGKSETVTSNGGSTSVTRLCTPGETQACLGPGQCAGAQVCSTTGASWGSCDCGSVAAGGGHPATGGVTAIGGSTGSGGMVTSATGGTMTTGGATAAGGTGTTSGVTTNAAGGATAVGGNSNVGGTSALASTSLTSGGVTNSGGAASGGAASGGGSLESSGGISASGGSSSASNSGTGGATFSTCNANLTSVGCTAVTPAQTGKLSGQYGTQNLTIGSKQYFLQVNEWGSSAAQSLNYGANYFFKMTQQNASLAPSGAPAGYPSVFIGANAGHSTLGSNLPKVVSTLESIPTTWNWADNGARTDSNAVFNAAYDVWFSTGAAEPDRGTPSGGFLMIWYYAQGCQPVGALNTAGHTINGLPGCWDVWTGTNNGTPVISYKHQGPLMTFGFDLNLFIRDALTNYPNYMKPTWALTNIFSGFEIWSGGSALESTSFCAEVN